MLHYAVDGVQHIDANLSAPVQLWLAQEIWPEIILNHRKKRAFVYLIDTNLFF